MVHQHVLTAVFDPFYVVQCNERQVTGFSIMDDAKNVTVNMLMMCFEYLKCAYVCV